MARDALLDPAITVARDWANKLTTDGRIRGAWLFGSSVSDGGLQFEGDRSDLDIIVEVDWEAMSPETRVAAIDALAKAKQELEGSLLLTLQPDHAGNAITSVVPMTAFELSHAIHKDGNSVITTGTPMLDLITGELLGALRANADTVSLHPQHRKVLEYVQKKRAGHMARTPNGKGGLGDVHDDLKDAVPKDLMRQFAVATANLSSTAGDSADLNRGLSEIQNYLQTFDPNPSLGVEVRDWVRRRVGRGKEDALPTRYYLFLLESAYDKVRNQYAGETRVSLSRAGRKISPASARQAPLPAPLTVSVRNALAGDTKAIRRAIDNARQNIAYKASPPFTLVFEEDPDADVLLSSDSTELTDADYVRQKAAFARRAMIANQTDAIEAAVRDILYYGGILFPEASGGPLTDLLRASLDKAIEHILNYGVANLGGGHDAFHFSLYPAAQGTAFMFSTRGHRASTADKGVISISAELRAESFVPELIAAVQRRETLLERPMSHEERMEFLSAHAWNFGRH